MKNYDKPQWVINSQRHLDSINSKILATKKAGQLEAKRGLEKLKKANKLQQEADYLSRVLSQQHPSTCWEDPVISGSAIMLENRIALFDNDMDRIQSIACASNETDEALHKQFLGSVESSDSSAGTAIYLTASIERRLQKIEPFYQPTLDANKPERLTSRLTTLEELKSNLISFDSKYIAMVDGSEITLSAESPDCLSQAAHSIRDCFQQIIEDLAPSSVVNLQPWFTSTNGAPGGVSRRSRLMYILYGSGENIDEREIQRFDELAEIAKSSLDHVIDRAHYHDISLTKEEVQLAIDQARDSLLQILRLYNGLRNR
jgi:hypothetical protein